MPCRSHTSGLQESSESGNHENERGDTGYTTEGVMDHVDLIPFIHSGAQGSSGVIETVVTPRR